MIDTQVQHLHIRRHHLILARLPIHYYPGQSGWGHQLGQCLAHKISTVKVNFLLWCERVELSQNKFHSNLYLSG